MRESRNCGLREFALEGGIGEDDFDIRLGKVKITQCPISFITPEANAFIDLFFICHSIGEGQVTRHSLPRSGGVFDQDNLTIEAFQVIENEILSIQKEKAEER